MGSYTPAGGCWPHVGKHDLRRAGCASISNIGHLGAAWLKAMTAVGMRLCPEILMAAPRRAFERIVAHGFDGASFVPISLGLSASHKIYWQC